MVGQHWDAPGVRKPANPRQVEKGSVQTRWTSMYASKTFLSLSFPRLSVSFSLGRKVTSDDPMNYTSECSQSRELREKGKHEKDYNEERDTRIPGETKQKRKRKSENCIRLSYFLFIPYLYSRNLYINTNAKSFDFFDSFVKGSSYEKRNAISLNCY